MKTLITGADGYIGGYLKKQFLKDNKDYVESNIDSFDYSDINSIRDFFKSKKIQKVIHLAGVLQNDSFDLLFKVNIYGLYNLLYVCAENNVSHFTFASGNNVYDRLSEKRLTEMDLCKPSFDNRYGFSKYVGELLIKDICSSTDMKYANVRIADVYGAGQKHGNLLKAIMGNAAKSEPLYLYGEGKRVRDYIYVKDVAEGLCYISSKEITGDINLGTGIGTSVKELINITNEICDSALEIKRISVENEDISSVVLDPKKLNDYGFFAKYTVKDGIKEILRGESNE